LHIQEWRNIRDLIVDLWDWWAEGVHLRPQPFIRDDTSVIDYKEPFSVWLVKTAAPIDLSHDELPVPRRIVTIDACLGDALFRLNCTLHFEINKATGWLEVVNGNEMKVNGPKMLWINATKGKDKRYQTQIMRADQSWLAFSPSSPDGKIQYLTVYASRINGAGWRPQGDFPHGVDMSGVDLADARLTISPFSQHPTSFRYARLQDALLNQCYFGEYSDFGFSFAERLQCHVSAGGYLNFSNADLSEATFANSMFWEPRLQGAQLAKTDFRGARLRGVNKKELPPGAYLEHAWFQKFDVVR
jgi:hypothetical protein